MKSFPRNENFSHLLRKLSLIPTFSILGDWPRDCPPLKRFACNMKFILTALLSLAVFLSHVFAGSPHHHAKGRTFTVGQAVRTSSGSITGHPASSRPDVSEYLGIPFAKPPIGDLRFAAPEAYVGSGNINATVYVRVLLGKAFSMMQETDKIHPLVSVRKSSHQL